MLALHTFYVVFFNALFFTKAESNLEEKKHIHTGTLAAFVIHLQNSSTLCGV